MNTQTTNVLSSKPLIALLLNGSFNPIHNQNLDKLERIKEDLEKEKKYEIVKGFISPNSEKHVNTEYLEKSIPLKHRVEMIKLAISKSPWIQIYEEESSSLNEVYLTHQVVDNLSRSLNKKTERPIKVMYICSSDYILNEEVQNLEINHLEEHGLIIIEEYIEDIKRNPNWEKECEKKLAELYKENGWETFKEEIIYIKYNEPTITSEKICNMIINGNNNWKKLCSTDVVTYIETNKILKFSSK
ncbi:hypothetical protein C2G38_2163412 [Gigaspora rosea]|uniref:Cytidyltransferase-like domain-containing protein n=1 Tax=Gigaspora rosea TaxID=44941 RepID=A0A397VZK0_9GLOM|nr:hypothetical protein C2G38_2163412 [Gigaspora rosea]